MYKPPPKRGRGRPRRPRSDPYASGGHLHWIREARSRRLTDDDDVENAQKASYYRTLRQVVEEYNRRSGENLSRSRVHQIMQSAEYKLRIRLKPLLQDTPHAAPPPV